MTFVFIRFHSFLSDSRLKGLRIRNLKIIDSTTLRLFSDLLRVVGRNPIHGGRKKGGIKVHTMMDAFSGVASFVRMTEAKVHDKKFLAHLTLETGSFIVFDKAYNVYLQFAQWSSEQIWFVTRMKKNAVFHVRKVIIDNTKKKNAKGVLKEQYVSLLQGSRWHTKETPTAQDHLQGRQRKGILLHDQQL